MYQTITTLIVVTLMFGSANAEICYTRTICTDKVTGIDYKYKDKYDQKWIAAGISDTSNCRTKACTGSSNELQTDLVNDCINNKDFHDAINGYLAEHGSHAHDTALCICKNGNGCQDTNNPNYHYFN